VACVEVVQLSLLTGLRKLQRNLNRSPGTWKLWLKELQKVGRITRLYGYLNNTHNFSNYTASNGSRVNSNLERIRKKPVLF
jgi:hypothetical protein